VLKADPELATIPVILVTAAGDLESRSKGIELGAEDYVTKPFRVFEIQQRIRNALRTRAAESAARRAQDTEPIDLLTRAGTSQQFVISLDYELTRAARFGHPLTCVLVRVDNYNEILAGGEDAGDGVLVQLAQALRGCIRGIDHLFRSNREEFAMLLPETDAGGGDVVLQRLHERVMDAETWKAMVKPAPLIRAAAASYPAPNITTGHALLAAVLHKLGTEPAT